MIKAVLFDMDGCLFDSEKYYKEGTMQWLNRLGLSITDEEYASLVGTTMETTYKMLYDMTNHVIPLEKIKEINEDYFLKENPLRCKEIMFDGVKEVIDELKKMGLKLALCSASSYDTIINHLTEMGIVDDFELITSGENFKQSKPNPEIYLYAKDHLGVKKAECIVYEDSNMGIQAGINAGIFTIAREDNRFNQDQSNANLIVKDIYGLLNYIKENMID